MAQKIGWFIVVSFIYSILYEVFRTGTRFIPFSESSGEMRYVITNAIAVFFLSMSLHHYYLDAVIWRVRKDKDVSDVV